MMMNEDMREAYDNLLRRVLETIPPTTFKSLSDDELLLFFQGLSEVNPNTILVPAVKETITQYRPIPIEQYRRRSN